LTAIKFNDDFRCNSQLTFLVLPFKVTKDLEDKFSLNIAGQYAKTLKWVPLMRVALFLGSRLDPLKEPILVLSLTSINLNTNR
jgi:hypothetical protein